MRSEEKFHIKPILNMAKLDIVRRLGGKDKIYDQIFTICRHKTE